MSDPNQQNPETPAEQSVTANSGPAEIDADQVKEALRVVNDPEIGLNVVQLGLIREISLGGDEGEIKMMLTTPFCPYGGWLIQQVKDTAEQVTGRKINIVVLPDLWDPNYMEDPGLLMGW